MSNRSRPKLLSPRLTLPLPSAEDQRAYLDEALGSARLLAGTLDYLVTLHAAQCERDEGLLATLGGLRQQARRVVDFLGECR